MVGRIPSCSWAFGWDQRIGHGKERVRSNWRPRTHTRHTQRRGAFHDRKKDRRNRNRKSIDPRRCSEKEWISVVETNGGETKRVILGPCAKEWTPPQTDQSETFTVKESIQNLLLPAGYPSSVTNDYLPYMVWTFPCHVFGWMYSSLTTASMLQAVGVSAGPTGVAAASAAIKWVTKDGLGAVGRLIIGSKFGTVFDENPRRWRMFAELFSVAGSLLELVTPLAPSNFLLLASIGNLSKAVGKGLANPSFRVIQNHFAKSENVGDVAAKEEVWEVAAQLAGLFLSVLLLQYDDFVTSYLDILALWSILVGLHILARFQALRVVTFTHLNRSRLIISAFSYIRNDGTLDIYDVNHREGIVLTFPDIQALHLQFGVSFDTVLAELRGNLSATNAHLQCFRHEKFVLVQCNDVYNVVFEEDFGMRDLLRATLMAAWMQDHRGSHVLCGLPDYVSAIKYLEKEFDTYISLLNSAGWELERTRISIGSYRIRRLLVSEPVP